MKRQPFNISLTKRGTAFGDKVLDDEKVKPFTAIKRYDNEKNFEHGVGRCCS
jgi:hypothetical protein